MTTTAPPILRFDEAKHEYWLGDILLPSTTQILKYCGFIDDRFYNEVARDRGTAAHAACHYLAEGDLDMDTLSPELRPYVEGYQRFLEDTKFRPEICEEPIYHPTLMYGTTPDQIGKLKVVTAVAELKTGKMMPWTAIQTAFQAMAKWPDDYLTKARIGVELGAKGKYRIDWFEDPNDFGVAMGALSVFGWRNTH